MTKNRIFQTSYSLFFLFLLFFTVRQQGCFAEPVTPPNTAGTVAETASKGLLPLTPTIRERVIARYYASILETMHISQRKLDEQVSKEALRLYIKGLDPLKVYFYQSDIDEFKKKYETKICELTQQQNGNVTPAFDIYNRYLQRISERVEMIMKILATPQDFSLDESLVRDKAKDFTLDSNIIREKGLQPFPATPEEAYERWRKRIKHDILGLKAEVIENAKKRERAVAEGKKPPKMTEERDPIERLQKRYTSFRKRMLLEGHIENGKILDDIRRAANDEVMESYLSAISGALDPHTNYLSPSSLESFNTMMGKKLEGIGATLSSEDGYTIVKKLVKGGPADKSGELKVDDKIRGVGQGADGKIEDVVDTKLSDVVKLIRGTKGTVVRLEVVRGDGGAAQVIEITRDEVTLEDSAAQKEIFEFGEKPDGSPYKIGFIELPDFYLDMDALRRGDPNARSTTSDVSRMLKGFVEKNVDVVILDLRYNGGGSLQEAIGVTGLFIDTGNVVQTKDEASSRPVQRDDNNPSCDWTGPLVVLTGKLSASASEIVAGAIKDYKRGLIVGSQTHGKGTVQQMMDLSERIMSSSGTDYGAIKVTIQGFYRPSGVSPQRLGVDADVTVPSWSDQLEDICESDLDNALVLNKVSPAANFTSRTAYVTPAVTAELQKRSAERVKHVDDFAKLENEQAIYKEIRARKSSTLNETKYFEELTRLDADRRDREEFEELSDKDSKIKRDYYVDEALAVAVDYIKYLQEIGISFPKERATAPQRTGIRSWLGW
ncbi:tail-specific protease [Planctomycetales bacterium]|nr:tail-specific protease [Planctomycetales bacterium]